MNQIKSILCLTLIAFIFQTNSHNVCDKTKFKGPFSISAVTSESLFIGSGTVSIQLFKFPTDIGVIIATRRRFINYCYDGSNIDPNTGCEKHEYNEFPNKQEILRWEKDNNCYTGDECNQEGECWGSDADKCWKKYDSYETVGDKLMGDKFTKWTLFAQHTCVQRWSCSFHFDRFPIYALYDGSNFITYTGDLHGVSINLTSSVITSGKTNDNRDYIIHFKDPQPFPSISYPSSTCYSPNPKIITCLVPIETDEGIKSIAFETHGKKITCIRNYCIKIISNVTTVNENNELMTLIPIDGSNDLDVNLFQAPTKESVRESINTNRAAQLKSEFNIIQLHNSIASIERVVNQMIKSLSKIDDELIGNIMNKRSKSKWINNHLFNLFSCKDSIDDYYSNCYGDLRYDRGKFNTSKDDPCTSIDMSRVIPLQIFKNETLNLNLIDQFNPDSTSTQWDGWSWLQDQQATSSDVKSVIPEKKKWSSLPVFFQGFPFNLGVAYQIIHFIFTFSGIIALTIVLFRR